MGFKTSSICPVLARGRWRPFTYVVVHSSHWDCGLRVRRQHCNSELSQPPLQSQRSCAWPHSAQVTPSAAYACGSNSESARSFASSCNEGFSNMLRPHHADHSPCPNLAYWPLSLPLFTRLLSESIPQATPVAAFSSLKLLIRHLMGSSFSPSKTPHSGPLPFPHLPSSTLRLPVWPCL